MAWLAAASMLVGTAWIGDDAFITLRVIDNFVNGYGLRYNVIERVQVFTHPLWLWVLTPFYALTREPMVTTMLVSVVVSMGALWVLATRIAKDALSGCLFILAAVASRAICHYSTSGLENPLTFLLLALFVWRLFDSKRRWVAAAIAGSLLLNRLDLIILVGPAVAYLALQARGADRARVILAASAPALAWLVFSTVYYGMPLPNTAYAKLGTGFSTGTLILRGLEYTREFAFADPLLAVLIVLAAFSSWRSRDWATRLLGAGVALYLGYIVLIGGDFMSGRFFSPPGFLAICLLAREPVPRWLTERAKALAVASLAVATAALLLLRVTEEPSIAVPANGIVDERRFYYSMTGLVPVVRSWVATGSEPVHPWGKKGLFLKAEAQRLGTSLVADQGNTGMLGFYAGPAVHNLDRLALTDAFLARLPAIPGARVGHYRRKVPLGYIETALDAHPSTEAEALRPLLNDVTLATRAPLLEGERWAAIWRLFSGRHRWIYEAHLYGE